LALTAAVGHSSADTLVIADADVWCDGLPEAVAAVETGADWAIPHAEVLRLTGDGTKAFLRGADAHSLPLDQPSYGGIEGGGQIVLKRATYVNCPIDPRFAGWGQEDEAWGTALRALYGPPWVGTASLVHLYHEPQVRLDRKRGSVAGWELRRRYLKARYDQDAMRDLIKEAHEHFPTIDSDVCSDAQVGEQRNR
jgi:hypothetical protein